MTDLTPEQEALRVLGWDLPRSELSAAAQLGYDRLKPAREQDAVRRAGPARRHKGDRSGRIHTFRVMRGFHLVSGIVTVLFAVGFLASDAVAVAYPSSSWARGDGGISTWYSTWDKIWPVPVGLLVIWLGIRLLRVGVQVSAGKMTYRGYFRTRTVDASEIRAITLQPKNDGNGDRWIPRVELTGGKGFWIQGFDCGPARKPPKPHQAARLNAVRALLKVRTDEISQPETSQGA